MCVSGGHQFLRRLLTPCAVPQDIPLLAELELSTAFKCNVVLSLAEGGIWPGIGVPIPPNWLYLGNIGNSH